MFENISRVPWDLVQSISQLVFVSYHLFMIILFNLKGQLSPQPILVMLSVNAFHMTNFSKTVNWSGLYSNPKYNTFFSDLVIFKFTLFGPEYIRYGRIVQILTWCSRKVLLLIIIRNSFEISKITLFVVWNMFLDYFCVELSQNQNLSKSINMFS